MPDRGKRVYPLAVGLQAPCRQFIVPVFATGADMPVSLAGAYVITVAAAHALHLDDVNVRA